MLCCLPGKKFYAVPNARGTTLEAFDDIEDPAPATIFFGATLTEEDEGFYSLYIRSSMAALPLEAPQSPMKPRKIPSTAPNIFKGGRV